MTTTARSNAEIIMFCLLSGVTCVIFIFLLLCLTSRVVAVTLTKMDNALVYGLLQAAFVTVFMQHSLRSDYGYVVSHGPALSDLDVFHSADTMDATDDISPEISVMQGSAQESAPNLPVVTVESVPNTSTGIAIVNPDHPYRVVLQIDAPGEPPRAKIIWKDADSLAAALDAQYKILMESDLGKLPNEVPAQTTCDDGDPFGVEPPTPGHDEHLRQGESPGVAAKIIMVAYLWHPLIGVLWVGWIGVTVLVACLWTFWAQKQPHLALLYRGINMKLAAHFAKYKK
ncbi:hypothetical protein Pelo_13650 [Pelomyxa schiedti]|nr:hypothetical protein Pelo_13650 [Pelomyxa schiedti]